MIVVALHLTSLTTWCRCLENLNFHAVMSGSRKKRRIAYWHGAVELESRQTADVSLAQLQEVATEAGIASSALAQALHKLRSGTLHRGSMPRHRPLSATLARFRRQAALTVVIAVAAITPGDVFAPLVMYSLPVFALYELGIRVARAVENRRPPSSPDAAATQTANVESSRGRVNDHVKRSLMLRPA